MIDLIPPWLEAIAGILGVSFALSGIARAQRFGWRGPQDRTTAYGLLILGVLLMGVGLIRWAGL
ncbi:hypothetical protein [Brevundimonas fluminis]|uniref:hypothetical protein n=1 Tax=Brevundimonas fluminis TaxID=2487274 RepID=UPI000F65669D|nr:hypothetical protein [Brevundimonas fluminis]